MPLTQDKLLKQIISHYQSDDRLEALAKCKVYLRQFAKDPIVLSLASGLALDLGELDQATVLLDELISLDPDHAGAHLNLGKVQERQGFAVLACSSYLRSYELNPSTDEALFGFATMSHLLGYFERAIDAYRTCTELYPEQTKFYFNMGNAYNDLGQLEDAIQSYDLALKLDGHNHNAWLNKATVYQVQGRLALAADAIDHALIEFPGCGEAWLALSKLKTFYAADTLDLVKMETVFEDGGAELNSRVSAGFANSKAHHDLHNTDRSFSILEQANHLKRSSFSYDVADDENWGRRIKGVFYANPKGASVRIPEVSSPHIFIVGMPRSGSTLIEQILSSHPSVFGGGEVGGLEQAIKSHSPSDQPQFPESMDGFSDRQIANIWRDFEVGMRKHSGDSPFITNKTLTNFFYIGFILRTAPGAKIIHCRRDPVDVGFSCFRQLFTQTGPRFSYNMGEIVRYSKLYNQLMLHWSELFGDQILTIDYEDMVSDFETQSHRLLAYCGLSWHDACRQFHKTRRDIKTASNLQVRKPLYKSSVGNAGLYRKHLGPFYQLRDDLEPGPA